MRHLLAGGGGFVGSHLAELFLARGDEVVVVDNFATGRRSNIAHLADHEGFSLIEHDITTPLPRLRHAVRHRPRPRQPGVAQRLRDDAARDPRGRLDRHTQPPRPRGCHTVPGSSSPRPARSTAIHWCTRSPRRYWGNVSSIGPRSCYDEAKRFSEAITMAYHRVHGLDVRIARIFNTYGERMRPDDGRVVNTFVVQALRGEPITLHGDGIADAQLLPCCRRDRRADRGARRPSHRSDQRR